MGALDAVAGYIENVKGAFGGEAIDALTEQELKERLPVAGVGQVGGPAGPLTPEGTLPASQSATNVVQRLGGTTTQTAALTYFNVRDYGAVGDGVTDDLAAFVAANAAANTSMVIVPPGNYALSDRFVLNESQVLLVSPGATLRRLAGAASTNEVVQLRGHFAKLIGEGKVHTEKASPRGIVHIGPDDAAHAGAALWTKVQGVQLQGVKAAGNIGLHVDSNEPAVVGSAVYFARVRDIEVRRVGTGVRVSKNANGCVFTDVQFWDIATDAWHFSECTEATIFGGFTHASAGVTMIRLENAANVHFYGIQGEPGAGSSFYNIDALCYQCKIIGHGDTPSVGTNLSTSTTILAGDSLTIPRVVGSASIESAAVKSNFITSSAVLRKTGIPPAGTAQLDITITVEAASLLTGGWLELRAVVMYEAGGQQAHLVVDPLTINGGTAGAGTAMTLVYNGSVGNFIVAAADFAITRPSSGVVRVVYTNASTASTNRVTFSLVNVHNLGSAVLA